MSIPYEHIAEKEDRFWTSRMLDEITLGNLSDLDALIKTFSQLNDYRAVPRLRKLLLSNDTPNAIRQAASDVLFKVESFDTAEERSSLWLSGSEILMRHAVRMAERTEKDLILEIGAQPDHPFFLDVVRKVEFWEEPQYQDIMTRALNHELASVRESAAKGLLWEQPSAAELTLLKLASDKNERIATAALNTLAWCAGCALILGLDDLRRNGREEVRDGYENVFGCMRREFLLCVEPGWLEDSSDLPISKWLKPVRHLIQPEKESEEPATKERSKDTQSNAQNKPIHFSAQEIMDELGEADGMWAQKKLRYLIYKGWHAAEGSERKKLSEFLVNNVDPSVREIGCRASAAWLDEEALLILMNDEFYSVRAVAAYACKYLPASVDIQMRLLDLINDPDTTNTFAREALESYRHHSQHLYLDGFLCELVVKDIRPSIRLAAMRRVSEGCPMSILKPVIALLSEPPVNTWQLHEAILNHLSDSYIPKAVLALLHSVDDLSLQVTLARR